MLPCTTGALAALFAPAGSSLGVPSLRYGPMLPLHAPTLSYCWATVQPSRQTLGCALLAVNCHGGALSILECAGRCLGLFSLQYAPMLPLNTSTLAHCCAYAQPSRQALSYALLAASRTAPMVPLCRGQGARFASWLLAPLGPFRGLFVPWLLGVQVTIGPASLDRCLAPQASAFWPL
ncbi:hypothetical protein V6N13_007782 [Hibiscus sabdariffa]